jgi:sporulation protein YlmC with PRC-barrel domain
MTIVAGHSGHTTAIRSKKVLGTTVKDPDGNTIGTVEDVVLDKQSNNIMFVVISFGGFLGIGEKYHPIPWSALEYDEEEDAYLVGYTRDQLEGAPADTIEELTRENGVPYRDRTYDYYGTTRYWE